MAAKKSLYRVTGDGIGYVMATSCAKAAEKWREHKKDEYPSDSSMWDVNSVERIADKEDVVL